MVTLSSIHTSNALISTHLPPHLVCVFLGGTSGIGESALKALVSHAVQPKIYLVGRNKASAERIIEECKGLGPEGYAGGAEVIWWKADLSRMKAVEGVCEEIKRRESKVNLVLLSTGTPSFDRSLTPEGLHAFLATAYYDRTLLIAHLAPLLLNASASDSLARVVSVGCGCDEGIIYPTDFPALKIPFSAIRGHFGTLTTLTLEALAQNTVDASAGVTFIHANPGLVRTPYQDRMTGWFGVFARALMWVKKMTGEAICDVVTLRVARNDRDSAAIGRELTLLYKHTVLIYESGSLIYESGSVRIRNDPYCYIRPPGRRRRPQNK